MSSYLNNTEHRSYKIYMESDIIVTDCIQSSLPLDEEMTLVKRFPTEICTLHVIYHPSTQSFAASVGTPRMDRRSITQWFPTREQALSQTFRVYTYRLYIRGRPQLWMEDYTDIVLTKDTVSWILTHSSSS